MWPRRCSPSHQYPYTPKTLKAQPGRPQVNVEVALTARYWTKVFVVFVVLSYLCAYLFMLLYMWVEVAFEIYDPAQYGVIYQLCLEPSFWFVQVRPAGRRLQGSGFPTWGSRACGPGHERVQYCMRFKPLIVKWVSAGVTGKWVLLGFGRCTSPAGPEPCAPVGLPAHDRRSFR